MDQNILNMLRGIQMVLQLLDLLQEMRMQTLRIMYGLDLEMFMVRVTYLDDQTRDMRQRTMLKHTVEDRRTV